MATITPSSFDFHSLPPQITRGLREQLRPAALSTGIAALDAFLPEGGLPAGRVVELTGGRAGGKLSLALIMAARLIARGDPAALIDPGGTVRPDPLREPALGSLLVVRGSDLLRALRATDALLRCGAFPLLVLDLTARGLGVVRPGALVRLAREADRACVVLMLLTEAAGAPATALSALVSLRLEVRRARATGTGTGTAAATATATGRLELAILKSKLGGTGSHHTLDLALA